VGEPGFFLWVETFEAEARRRVTHGDPDWAQGARLDCAVVRSIQRFQVGESGDGANLIETAETAGGADYVAAVRLFVAEEQNHARLLALLLTAANASTIRRHWSDVAFVRLRRALGLRLELMVLLIAEVIALGYYRALRDGSDDPLTRDVAGRILADERRHVPFHCQRLHAGFVALPRLVWPLVLAVWRSLLYGTALVVVGDHGAALRELGVTRRRFFMHVAVLFERAIVDVRRGRQTWCGSVPQSTAGRSSIPTE